ncbi:putative transporter ESBP6 [Yarrowia sp. C11]|nr:putative transporter ESBP6 [Yarrowia sp. E02]KAG5372698.1 putative transporter ESBP6 [Yarrowia sp. C11]
MSDSQKGEKATYVVSPDYAGMDYDVEAGIIDDTDTCSSPTAAPLPAVKLGAQIGEADQEEFPEGGRGWLVVAGTSCALNTGFGMVNAFGIYMTYYGQEMFPNTSSSTMSLIGGLQVSVVYFSSIPVRMLINKLGVQPVLAIGGFLIVLSLMMTSISTQVWHLFLAQGVTFGLGAGCCYLPAVSVPSEYFKKKRALALGVTAAGSSVGGVIWPIAIKRLLVSVGFAWTNRIIGFIFIPVLVFMVWATKPRLAHSKQQVSFELLKNWRFLVLCAAQMVGMFGVFPALFYVDTYGERLGNLPPSILNYSVAILNASSVLGRIGPAYLADRVGRLNVLTPFVCLTGLFPLVFWLPSRGESLFVLFLVLWGIASGCFISMFPSCVGQLFGVKHTLSGIALLNMAGAPGSLAGGAIGGKFLPLPDVAQGIEGFTGLIVFSGVVMLVSSLILLSLRLSISFKPTAFI